MTDRSPGAGRRGSRGDGGAGGICNVGAASRMGAFFSKLKAACRRAPPSAPPRELRLPPRRRGDDVVAFRDRRPASWRSLAFDRPDIAEARGIKIIIGSGR